MIRRRARYPALWCLLLVAPALYASRPAAAASTSPPNRTLESGWSAEGYVDPAFQAERAQIALYEFGIATSVWAGRATSNDPLQIRWSRLSGTAWSASLPAFPPTTASERLPQLSRAPDGTLWLAWLRDNNQLGVGPFHAPSLMAARLSGGAWSAPETVAVAIALPNPAAIEVEFSILAVSHDEAWLAWGVPPDGDPFSSDRDLMYSVRSAAGWSNAQILSNNGLAETRPVLVQTTNGTPVAFFAFRNAPSLLRAVRWTGPGGWSPTPDDLSALAFFSFDAAPDTNGAVRLIAIAREAVGSTSEFHIREFTWDAGGFRRGPLLNSAPVLAGGENDPPDWSNVAIASGHACPICVSPINDLIFRVLWVDQSQSGTPKVLSSLRTASGFNPYELVGTSFERTLAFPNAVHDVSLDRWYATWTAPPAFDGRTRAKFAFTQEFAGDLGVGATFLAPDTVRVTTVCSGDGTGRAFRLYRLNWPQGSPPFSPPLPAGAVALPGNPHAGPCPILVDDFPGPGRWFYYVELDAEGTFPARSARSFNAVVVPKGGGGGTPGSTALLSPRPRPAVGSVSFPFDLGVDGRVTLSIRNLSGRVVRRFDLGARTAGEYRPPMAPVWNGRDESGQLVPAGMYFLTIFVDGRAQGRPERIVLLGHNQTVTL